MQILLWMVLTVATWQGVMLAESTHLEPAASMSQRRASSPSPSCQSFPIGNSFAVKNSSRLPEFTSDGQIALVPTYGNILKLFEVKSGKLLADVQHPHLVSAIDVFKKGDRGAIGTNFGYVEVFEVPSGKKVFDVPLSLGDYVIRVRFSPDGNFLAIASEKNGLQIFDARNGKKTAQFESKKCVEDVSWTVDGKKVAVAIKGYGFKQYDTATREQLSDIKFNGYFNLDNDAVSRDAQFGFGQDDKSKVFDLAARKDITDRFEGLGKGIVRFSPSGKFLLGQNTENGSFTVYDPETGKVVNRGNQRAPIHSSQWTTDDRLLFVNGEGRVDSQIIDLVRNNRVSAHRPKREVHGFGLSPDGNVVTYMRHGGVTFDSSKSLCVSSIPQIQAGPLAQSFEAPEAVQKLCKLPFQELEWNKLTFSPVPPALSLRSTDLYLLRFQKPGGFIPAEHLPLFLSMLKSKEFRQHRMAEVASVLSNILATSPLLYESLLEEFPWLSEKIFAPEMKPRCRSIDEEQKISQAVQNYLNYLLELNGERTKFSVWKKLRPLTPVLAAFNADKKEEYIYQITNAIADAASDSRELHGIFHSKLYYFAKEAVNPLFGEKKHLFTDATVEREGQTVLPHILATEMIDGDSATETDFGFFEKRMPPILLPADAHPGSFEKRHLHWKSGDLSYSAELQINVLESIKLKDRKDFAPAELWKDGKLTGVIITGTNLRGIAANVMDQYLGYYRDQGFRFSSRPEELPDVDSFLQDAVESGSMDYLIKEAHSDGDEKNVFRFDSQARILTGVRDVPGEADKKEVIHLVFPDADSQKTHLLSNDQFGEWVRTREAKGQGPVVYFNTSCWSDKKAVCEIEATHSDALINIPTSTVAYTFANHPSNAEFLLLDSFRRGGSFQQTRKALEQNPEYRQDKGNVFLFPDEDRYKSRITDILKVPIHTQIVVRDNQGRVLDLDLQH